MSLRDTLRGTGVALVTPFNQRHEVDFEAFGKVIEFVLARRGRIPGSLRNNR
ncbi:MAG: hypothetical protein WKG06_08620 [Segetibacter sp.]